MSEHVCFTATVVNFGSRDLGRVAADLRKKGKPYAARGSASAPLSTYCGNYLVLGNVST